MTKRILVTGSEGRIGSIVSQHLETVGHEVIHFDLPEYDARQQHQITETIRTGGAQVVIHLALGALPTTDDLRDQRSPEDKLMNKNVVAAARESGLGPRLILASSVHADRFQDLVDQRLAGARVSLIHPDSPRATFDELTPYGQYKRLMETKARQYANLHSAGAICIRFGAVEVEEDAPGVPNDFAVRLEHRDLLSVMDRTLEIENIPGGFAAFYAVSLSEFNVHSLANTIGWEPYGTAPGR